MSYSLVAKGAGLDRQFEPRLTAGCVCAASPFWCGLGRCSRTGAINNSAAPRRPFILYSQRLQCGILLVITDGVSARARSRRAE